MAKFTGIRARGCRNFIELDVRVADEHNGQGRESENNLLEHLWRGRETVREGRQQYVRTRCMPISERVGSMQARVGLLGG